MSIIQIILIAIFVYLGSIGSIVGNTIGWYTLGRPLVAALVVGVILGDIQTAMAVEFRYRSCIWATSRRAAQFAWDFIVCHLHRCRRSDRLRSGLDTYQGDRSGCGLRRNRRTGRSGHVEFVVCLKPAAEPGCRKICRSRGYPQNDRSERLHGSGNRFLMPLCSGSARSDVDDGRFRSG